MKKPSILLFISLFVCIPLYSQKITNVKSGYVLIDTNIGIGEINDVIDVYRNMDGPSVSVGKVRLIKFTATQTAAQIIEEKHGFIITVGDYVKNVDDYDALLNGLIEEQQTSSTTERQYNQYPTQKTKSNFLGIQGGGLLPIGDFADGYTTSIFFGGFIDFKISSNMMASIGVNYSPLNFESSVENTLQASGLTAEASLTFINLIIKVIPHQSCTKKY